MIGGDDVTIAQTESSRCWFLLVASGQFGLLYASAVRAAAASLAGADRDSMVSQQREAQLHCLFLVCSCFLRARCTTHDGFFSREIVILGFPELKKSPAALLACGAFEHS